MLLGVVLLSLHTIVVAATVATPCKAAGKKCGRSDPISPTCCGLGQCRTPFDCGGPPPPPHPFTCFEPPPPPPPRGCKAVGDACGGAGLGDCSPDTACHSISCQDGRCYQPPPPVRPAARCTLDPTLPPNITAHTSEALCAGFLDATLPPYSARGDGATDDSAALQAALDDAYINRMAVLLPAGRTFVLARQLRAVQRFGFPPDRERGYQLVGGRGPTPPVLRILDSASVASFPPIYGSSSEAGHVARPILLYALNRTGRANDAASHYSALLRNVDIDLGDNPALSGVAMCVHVELDHRHHPPSVCHEGVGRQRLLATDTSRPPRCMLHVRMCGGGSSCFASLPRGLMGVPCPTACPDPTAQVGRAAVRHRGRADHGHALHSWHRRPARLWRVQRQRPSDRRAVRDMGTGLPTQSQHHRPGCSEPERGRDLGPCDRLARVDISACLAALPYAFRARASTYCRLSARPPPEHALSRAPFLLM